MIERKIDAVIFDLDDTLVDTSKLKMFRETRDVSGLKENIDESRLFAPVPKILEEIKSRGIPVALVTNSPRWYAELILNHYNINNFDVTICFDDVGPDGVKPSSKGIDMALERLGLTHHSNSIYIGDEDNDVIAAYSANIKPVAPSWATRRHPLEQVPAAIINSEHLIECLDKYNELALIADRTASNRAFNFPKLQMDFLPLNEKGQVVPLRKEDIKLIAFGRYFSQGSPLTARLHESHQLSKDIFAKEGSETYIVPQYYVNLFSRVVETLPAFAFEPENSFFDIVTVIPAKQHKNGRLENMLRRVADKARSKSRFIPDLFEFSTGSVSLKTLGCKSSRLSELRENLHVKSKYISELDGKSVLIIDDVITTGATFQRAFELLELAKAGFSMGTCLAKTVSLRDEMKFCPDCGRLMKIRTNQSTGIHFYGCTGFYEKVDRCAYTETIKVKDCPRCGKPVFTKYNRAKGTHFLSCSSFGTSEACGYTENVDEV